MLQENHPVICKILNLFCQEDLTEGSVSLLRTGHVSCASKTTNYIQTTLTISPDRSRHGVFSEEPGSGRQQVSGMLQAFPAAFH